MFFVIFPTLEDYNAFRAECPDAIADPRTKLGDPAWEFPGDEETPPSGRVFACHHFTAEEAIMLQMAGAEVRVGGVDGPEFGEEI